MRNFVGLFVIYLFSILVASPASAQASVCSDLVEPTRSACVAAWQRCTDETCRTAVAEKAALRGKILAKCEEARLTIARFERDGVTYSTEEAAFKKSALLLRGCPAAVNRYDRTWSKIFDQM